MKKIFITATDTDAGKTFVGCALTQAFINAGKKVAVYKPVSAGCDLVAGQLINEDANLLSQFANLEQTIKEVNPIAFAQPIAPHIAASNASQTITLADIHSGYKKVLANQADITITEGAGGWRLPLSTEQDNTVFLSEFAKETAQEVVLVVNMKLGCLNHAMLTYETIKADGLSCIGWIANNASTDVMSNLSENIASLTQLLPMPKIAEISFDNSDISLIEKIKKAVHKINLQNLKAT